MKRTSAILTRLLCSFSVAGLLFAAPSAPAQTLGSARVMIPFDFTVNGMRAPAGQYLVRRTSFDMMSVVNLKTGTTQFWMVRQEQGRKTEDHGRLVFERNGRETYLTQIWLDGSANYSQTLGRPKFDRQVVAKNDSASSSSFEIALK